MFTKTNILFAVLILGVVLVLVFARSQSEPQEGGRFWPGTEVACLPFGHQNLAQHIHPYLEVTVDGAPEPIPANVGTALDCMSELHTHDATGEVHIETADPSRSFSPSNFFTVWGRPFEREGYTRTVRVNGNEIEDPASYLMQDKDHIEIIYTSN